MARKIPKRPDPNGDPNPQLPSRKDRLPTSEKWVGLLIRIAGKHNTMDRLFFIPTTTMEMYELNDDDVKEAGVATVNDVIAALDRSGKRAWGLKNALLLHADGPHVLAGRLVGIIEDLEFGSGGDIRPLLPS